MGPPPHSLIQSSSPGANSRLEEGSISLRCWGSFHLAFCALRGVVWWHFAWGWFVGLVPSIWWEYDLILVICLSFSSLFYWVSMAGGCHGDYRVVATRASVAGPAASALQPHWLPRGSSMFLPPGLCVAPLCLFFCFLNIFPFMKDFKHIEVEK